MERIGDFFSTPELQSSVRRSHETFAHHQWASVGSPHFQTFILTALKLLADRPRHFDDFCAYSIDRYGVRFQNEMDGEIDSEAFHNILIHCYRFLSEYNFYREGESPDSLAYEVERALDLIRYEVVDIRKNVKNQLIYIDNFMPVALAKSYLFKADFGLMREFDTKHGGLGKTITELDTKLAQSTQDVNKLHDALKSYKDAFNFVGLHKGFDDIARSKRNSARISMALMTLLAGLMVAPFVWKLWNIFNGVPAIGAGIELLVALIGYDLLLLYFFRVLYHGYKSVKGQLVQLDLRRAVCQFIQSYAEYAVKIKGDNPALLEKFEALVFSGIVTNEDNIPSTFDGLEQMVKLLEKVKGR